MFSTILDKVSGFFDRRNLISSFFPSLIFWALVVATFMALQVDWRTAINTWDKLSLTIQFLLLLTFFVWVTFWSFLTSNFRMAFTRWFEGYWPNKQPFKKLRQWRRDYWRKRWSELDQHDKELEALEATLLREQIEYEKLFTTLTSGQATDPQVTTPITEFYQRIKQILQTLYPKVSSTTSSTATPTIDQMTTPSAVSDATKLGQELDDFLLQLEAKLASSNTDTAQHPGPYSSMDLQSFGQQTRNWWVKLKPSIAEAKQKHTNSWARRYDRLEKVTTQLSQLVKQQYDEVQVQRQSLYHDLSLYYPSEQSAIMPTRLGNVLKATELYPWYRYRIDAVIIWSRLQASIPDVFSSSLQDANASLDLMTTLSTFILLFGLPLSIWITFNTNELLPWWSALALALVALAFRLYIAAGIAVLVLILTLSIPHPMLFLVRLQILVILLISILLLFQLCYQNAVQAALDYGDKVKAAFDLYRWKVLDELHLELPKDFEEERDIWEKVSGLLARRYSPDHFYYRSEKKKEE